MTISKVVYGTKTLVDLTSDTVDAAHLARGYTAHDAAGNTIVGTLEQQGQQQSGGNLLSGITPSLLNGAMKSGKTYIIPGGGKNGTEYIEYHLDIPTLTADVTYCLYAYGKPEGDRYSMKTFFYYQGADLSNNFGNGRFMFSNPYSNVQAVAFSLAAGAKPTRIVLEATGSYESLSISNITLVKLDT